MMERTRKYGPEIGGVSGAEESLVAPGRALALRRAAAPAMGARIERNAARHEARHARRCVRAGAALLSVTLLSGLAAACGGGDAEKARVAAAVKSNGAVVMPKAEPVSGATLVSNPASGTGSVDPDRTIPENVTYGDAEKVYALGRYREATDLFGAYVERKPENPWGRYMLGLSAWKSGDVELAESALREAVKLSPNHVKGSLNLARVLLDADKPKDAVEFATRATDIEPTNGEAWRVLGNALSELGEFDGAEQAYREALVVDDSDAWSMNNLGLLRIRHGLYEEALPPLARAVELKPNSALFQNNLGVALERTGHLVEALETYRKAVEADPSHGKAGASVTRLEPIVAKSEPHPIHLSDLAGAFRDQISGWKSGGELEPVPEVGPVPVQKSDTTVRTKPDTTVGTKPDTTVTPKSGGTRGEGHGC